jgi:sortase A
MSMNSRSAGRVQKLARRLLKPTKRVARLWRIPVLAAIAIVSIASGFILLAYSRYLAWDPGARQAHDHMAKRFHRHWQHHGAGHTTALTLVPGQPFAVMRIPRLGPGWRFAIIQGTTPPDLAKGPGHVIGTQLPGEPGNFAVAGHDSTADHPFLHLARVRPGDPIVVETLNATYRYQVTSERVVSYADAGVLAPVPSHPGLRPTRGAITLITCTTATLGFAPHRVIVNGTLAGTTWKRP